MHALFTWRKSMHVHRGTLQKWHIKSIFVASKNYSWTIDFTWTTLTMSSQRFCELTAVGPLLSMNEWCIYIELYCVLLYTQSALQSCGGLSSNTTSVQHPLGWCDGCHRTTAPVRSPHTSYRWRGERDIEPIKCMRSPHTSYRWRGERESKSQSSVCAHHTPDTGGEERES